MLVHHRLMVKAWAVSTYRRLKVSANLFMVSQGPNPSVSDYGLSHFPQ